jgi:hypothetical protein
MSKGGARNKANRRSLVIALRGAVNVHEATWFALAIGLGFNRFTTIHWERGRVEDGYFATMRFLQLASAWVRSQGGEWAFVWVRENGPKKGEHVHILMRIPPALAKGFRRRQAGWIKACGAVRNEGVTHSVPIGWSLANADQTGYAREHYERNLAEVLDYVLKGAGKDARGKLGLRRREPSGVIVGKRCGTSQNIGEMARRRGIGKASK